MNERFLHTVQYPRPNMLLKCYHQALGLPLGQVTPEKENG
jgi:hypothetical protein